jgi:RNA polymerase-binding transcription factor DksA
VTIRYDAPLEEAAERMVEARIGGLPVIDEEGRLDGILTETDLLHALITMLWAERRAGAAPERASLVDALENERDHLVHQLAAYGRHEQELTETRREIPSDLAEQGSDAEDGRLTEQLAELAAKRLRAIEHALERAGRDELATCERCGGRIPEARLRALPGTALCIRCARAVEAGR